MVGLLAGIRAWLLFVLSAFGLGGGPGGVAVASAVGLVAGLVTWLGVGLIAGMSRPGTDNTSPLSPLSSWRSDRAFGLVVGLVVWLALGLGGGLATGLATGSGDAG